MPIIESNHIILNSLKYLHICIFGNYKPLYRILRTKLNFHISLANIRIYFIFGQNVGLSFIDIENSPAQKTHTRTRTDTHVLYVLVNQIMQRLVQYLNARISDDLYTYI